MKMEHDVTFMNLKEAFHQQCCPLCAIDYEFEKKCLNNLVYENVNDLQTRSEINRSLGFCARHFHLLYLIEHEELRDHLGTSIILENIMEIIKNNMDACLVPLSWVERIKRGGGSDPLRSKMRSLLVPESECCLCEQLKECDVLYIQTIIENFRDEEITAMMERSPGLCLHHLQAAISCYNGDTRLLYNFLKWHIDKVAEIKHDLGEYGRKHSYEFASEPKGKEQNSVENAIEFLIGTQH
jgi:hypothetical protein